MVMISWSSEQWWEYYKLRLLIGALILVFVSAFTSYKELKYLIFGKKADGQVLSADLYGKQSIDGDVTPTTLALKYQFIEAGGEPRTETDDVAPALAAQYSRGSPITIQYLPGNPGDSRLAGHTRAWLTIPFIACSLVLTVVGVKFMREYREHERGMGRR